jgi:hypothetical protein
MKNFKLKLVTSFVVAALLIPTIGVYAEGTASTTSKLGNAIVKQQNKLQTYKERQQFKDEMSGKKDIIKKNHETNQSIRKAISEKRTTVKEINKEIKEKHKLLTSEELVLIDSQLKLIEADTAQLEAAKGKIKEASEQFRKEMENNNYDEAEIQLDNIIAVQNTRTDNLNKLSTDIDALISLLQTALTNAATVSEKPSI